MSKVLLVDYYGTCDKKGRPIGHSPKVLKEYCRLLKEDFQVSAAVSPCLLNDARGNFEQVYSLKYDIVADEVQSVFKRILDKIKLFYNIHQVLKRNEYDIIWFYRTDFFLFFYFSLMIRRHSAKIIGQVYQEEFAQGAMGKILNIVYHGGTSKFDGLIYTQKGMARKHSHTLYIPDYYYDEEKYGKYRSVKKENKAVCLGTMNPYKKLEELVEAFNRNGERLEIRGYFYDKERFHRLIEMKKDNIIIEDRILTEEEYYTTLASAKYSVLPYDMNQYNNRTSGILQESFFMNMIIVAPKKLLEENGMEGIGYQKIEELGDFKEMVFQQDLKSKSGVEEYDKVKVQKELHAFLTTI